MVNTERIPNGYHITEAGILPTEWQVKKLNEVVTELTERAGQDMYETVSISAGIGFVNQAEKFGKELSGKQYEKYIVLHKGDFSYNKGNSKTSPQGCIYRLNDRESAAVPNVFESFRIKEQDADYYEQLFLSGFLNRQLYSRINRGVRDDGLLNLTGKDFYSCMVPVPPIDEQKQIAKILAQCDKVIELKQQLIAEEEKKKRWLIENLLADGVETEFHKCCTNTGEYGLNAPSCPFNPSLPRYIRITDIDDRGRYQRENPVSVDIQDVENYLLEEGDILFVRTGGTVGKAYRYIPQDGELVYAGFLIKFSINQKLYDARFIYYQFFTRRYRNWVATMSARSGQPGINATEYGKYLVKIPGPIQKQSKIADVLCASDILIDRLTQELNQWNLKKAALSKLLL
ncbi:MAG: restriction endonuclease subunit S [Subdoligranulum sp.]|nr:restriction endonuclease subunit S [Subdoligranulum sp.]MDY6125902.1 restriction endonuclease subunit S [Gemmiger qucibialis]